MLGYVVTACRSQGCCRVDGDCCGQQLQLPPLLLHTAASALTAPAPFPALHPMLRCALQIAIDNRGPKGEMQVFNQFTEQFRWVGSCAAP